MSGSLYPEASQYKPLDRLPVEDDRNILSTGTDGIETIIEKRPILNSYLPVHPIQRYTLKKWSVDDWNRHNENKYFQANRDKESSRVLREEIKELIRDTDVRANKTQVNNTECLGERIQNIKYWKFELERGIADMTNEISLLNSEIRRLENAIKATEKPTSIARDCLSHRQRRIDNDLVQDEAEKSLLRELEMISNVKDILSKNLQQARERMTACRTAKEILEHDWSDKFMSHRLDSKSVSLKNDRGNHVYKPGVAAYFERESNPENWLEFSQKNLRASEQEREASIRLRGVINCILSQTSGDLRGQADRVEEALNRRIAETEDAVRRLEGELKSTVVEITDLETSISNLNMSHWDKQAPIKVAQSRLTNRHQRPNVEMCRDDPAHGLIEEVRELETSLTRLEVKLSDGEDRLRDLQHSRTAIEKELTVKRNSIQIDRGKCLRIRSRYPSLNTLCGHQ
ncbi:tektin-4 [Lepeophtheirus salmonis]|uniref:tektin-4 n=1 Tax=Lepeophtheirus salmonis TaxID=72036 RepID=UPI001AE1654D|nr:tektin-4-like [Lepeophtheirus salmonis]XP_040564680.1 tektin-4-like [Lepeophtheirus salmonis]XP_040564681.1 tektin-4-like [Lepeophtheirus salmonis]